MAAGMIATDTPTRTAPHRSLAEIADAIEGKLSGDGEIVVRRVVHPAAAEGDGDLALAIEKDAAAALAGTAARAAVVAAGTEPPVQIRSFVTIERPRYALARLLALFEVPPYAPVGVHPSAVVEPTARLGEQVSIGPFVHVGPEAEIGNGTVVLSHVSIGAGARIGAHCRIHSGTRIGERVIVGDRVILQHNVSLGGDGFSYATPEPGSVETARATGRVEARNTVIARIPSLGTVILGDDVEIGAGSTIDRGTIAATTVGRGTKIDNLVLIGHNVTIGENCLICGNVGLSGSTRIGDRVVLAGGVGSSDHASIGDDSIVMAYAGVVGDLPAGGIFVGQPAIARDEFFRQFRNIKRLGRMHDKLGEIEKRLAAIEPAAAG
jgi:UDP-3-O-[3-hydroxymyristoyl] glucosamine N-acyltransferase